MKQINYRKHAIGKRNLAKVFVDTRAEQVFQQGHLAENRNF